MRLDSAILGLTAVGEFPKFTSPGYVVTACGEVSEPAEGARLLSEYTGLNLYRGFKSLPLRHLIVKSAAYDNREQLIFLCVQLCSEDMRILKRILPSQYPRKKLGGTSGFAA